MRHGLYDEDTAGWTGNAAELDLGGGAHAGAEGGGESSSRRPLHVRLGSQDEDVWERTVVDAYGWRTWRSGGGWSWVWGGEGEEQDAGKKGPRAFASG